MADIIIIDVLTLVREEMRVISRVRETTCGC
jgi:hypothetical protein